MIFSVNCSFKILPSLLLIQSALTGTQIRLTRLTSLAAVCSWYVGVSSQVNLVSEHIWCDDFLVRSFYLKNMQTNETRTVTQFHFLTWLNQNVPETSRTLLDFRR